MDFIDRLRNLTKKIESLGAIETEEATKNALIMPFLHSVLGYDVFNPNEVVPEFVADVATKKGEKVDYALKQDGEIKILIQSKKSLQNPRAQKIQYKFSAVADVKQPCLKNWKTGIGCHKSGLCTTIFRSSSNDDHKINIYDPYLVTTGCKK